MESSDPDEDDYFIYLNMVNATLKWKSLNRSKSDFVMFCTKIWEEAAAFEKEPLKSAWASIMLKKPQK